MVTIKDYTKKIEDGEIPIETHGQGEAMSIVRVACPWTGLVGRIKLHGYVDTRMWRWMTMEVIHLDVMQAHVINFQSLLTKVDKERAIPSGKTPADYFKWWYDKITTLRPSLSPLILDAQNKRAEYYPLTCSACGAFRAHWNKSRSNHVQTEPS